MFSSCWRLKLKIVVVYANRWYTITEVADDGWSLESRSLLHEGTGGCTASSCFTPFDVDPSHDLLRDSTDRLPIKKTTPSPVYAFASRFCSDAPNKHYFLKQKLSTEPSHTSEPQYLAPQSLGPQRYIRLGTNFLNHHNTPETIPPTTVTISIAEA